MSDPIIPFERLPPGFGDAVDRPPETPATPRPAATVVLMRDGAGGLEVLLLRRSRASGFVPGAYVFPGGRVDPEDGDPELIAKVNGLAPEEAARRLSHPEGNLPAIAYYIAVVREAFEETGLLLARAGGTEGAGGTAGTGGSVRAGSTDDPVEGGHGPGHFDPARWTRGGAEDVDVLRARDDLLEARAGFGEVLDRLKCRIAADALAYFAHWVTPLAEPRRYDTRFFAVGVPPGREVSLDAREMIDAIWPTPARALALNEEGALPLVFPTLKTLESLRGFGSVEEALADLRGRPVHPILPKLVRTPTGIGIEIPEKP